MNAIIHEILGSGFTHDRVVSVAVTLFFLVSYFIGRASSENQETSIFFMNGFFMGSWLYMFSELRGVSEVFHDNIRVAITQRNSLLIFATAVIAICFMEPRQSRARVLAANALGLISICLLILSTTRSAYLCLMVFLVLLLYFEKSKKIRLQVLSFYLIGGLFLSMAKYCGLFVINPGRVTGIVSSAIRGDQAGIRRDHSANVRLAIYNEIYAMSKNDWLVPIFGQGEVGIGHTMRPLIVDGVTYANMSAHSEYFDVFVRRGFVGLLLFAFQIFAPFYVAAKSDPLTISGRMRTIIAIGLIATLAYGLFNESIRYLPFGIAFYVLLGFILGDSRKVLEKAADAPGS
ncbi:MAG: O-antigen ligase family protein [Elusimicrobia bacterium]|nr:O-antigen ligase family protein [Elusimicrobiota bacterium]